MEVRIKSTNQGESSNEADWAKKFVILPGVENEEGAECTETMFAPHSAYKPMQTDLNSTTASSENLAAKFKYPRKSQDVGEYGKGQYEEGSEADEHSKGYAV